MNSISPTSYLRSRWVGIALLVILSLALGLRLYGINWDQGYGFHPDERSIYMQSDCMFRLLTHGQGYQDCPTFKDFPSMEPGLPSFGVIFDSERSPLNPHWFPLGSILIYLLVLIRSVFEPFLDLTALDLRFAGRTLSALADVSSIYLLFLLGRRLFDQRVGLLAATLMALAVVHIQNSHFYRPETFIVFFVLAALWFMINITERHRLKDAVFLGIFVGLTFATKVSVVPLLLPIFLVYVIRLCRPPSGVTIEPKPRELYRLVKHVVTAGSIAMVVFFVLTPYAIIDLSKFLGDTTWEASIARVAGRMPYTVQYINSTPFIYELQQTSIWAMGLPLGIMAWGGLLYALYRTVKRHQDWKGDLVLLAWVLPNFLLVGGFFEVKFLRYMFPIIPLLILFGARWMIALQDGARVLANSISGEMGQLSLYQTLQKLSSPASLVLIAIVLATSMLYAFGFMAIYTRPHTAIAASSWINQNVEPGAVIVTDNHWDEGIPETYPYDVRQLPIYEGDSLSKMKGIANDLSEAQYLVFYSNRTYGSIARVPHRYPLSSRYYHQLFEGNLGYQLDQFFTSYPELPGIALKNNTFGRAGLPEPDILREISPAPLTLDLGYADENVTNYDHPAVLIFKNQKDMPSEDILELITASQPSHIEPGLMLTQEEANAQRQGGTWSNIIKPQSWANQAPILAWLLLVEMIYLASLPLAFFIFRPLPDKGIILARILGLLGVSYVAWLLASLNWLSFSRESMLAGLLVMAGLSLLVILKNRRQLHAFLREHWKLLVVGEALFLIAFFSFLGLRLANPDLWHPYVGGEKPMDLAYLTAILRSTTMPPFDPWFAGGYINYYYWGLFVVANLIKAIGVLPSVAYNLAVPLFFALTVTASYSIVYNVAAGLGVTGSNSIGAPNIHKRHIKDALHWLKTPIAAGLLAALFVTVIGNLDGAIQLIQSVWGSVVFGEPFADFDFWRSSRMLPELEDIDPSVFTFWLSDRQVLSPDAFCLSGLRTNNTCPDIAHHITEFPFFSFLFGDLHAHVIVMPFALLVLGLGLAFMVGLKAATKRWVIGVIPFFALALGSLWTINSWDYPAYLLLMLAMLSIGVHLMVGRANHNERVWTFIGVSTSTVLLSILFFLPFHLHYETFGTLLEVAKWQTPLTAYLSIHGLFVFLILSFLIYINRRPLKTIILILVSLPARTKKPSVHLPACSFKIAWEAVVMPLMLILIAYLAATGYWTAAILTALIGLATMAVREEFSKLDNRSGYILFPTTIAAFAFLVGVGVEFVRVGDDIGRMNTLFKFYLEGWILMALASAIGLWYLVKRDPFHSRTLALPRRLLVLGLLGKTFWLTLLAILVISTLIYTTLGTQSRLSSRFDTQDMTLNGELFMSKAVHQEQGISFELRWDYDAILWLRNNVEGSPVVLEGHTEQYRWGGRISTYTGLPTIIGWPWHQMQQRGADSSAIHKRIADVVEAYSTNNPKRALDIVEAYDVEYIVVGDLERILYPLDGLSKFKGMETRGIIRTVYSNQKTRIYQMLPIHQSSSSSDGSPTRKPLPLSSTEYSDLIGSLRREEMVSTKCCLT